MINEELKKYITEYIFPSYRKNDLGHNLEHIEYVIKRSLEFAKQVNDINYDMVYTIASYHDIGHYIDAKNHEKVSSEMLLADKKLKDFFSDEQIKIMADAVYDHRASLEGEPRNIYGKIVSSADRNVILDVVLRRTYEYRINHNPESTLEEIIEDSRQHIINKFGINGYANKKMYFEDIDYQKYLKDCEKILENEKEFNKIYMEVNGLNNKLKLEFDEAKRKNPTMSLDEILRLTYENLKVDAYYDDIKKEILEANNINELEYYTKNVNPELKKYIAEFVFPEYDKNDLGHNIIHIKEVIRRSFALNDTFKLGLDDNMIYAIAACHDRGKYIDSSIHEKLAANLFYEDLNMKKFFTDEERLIIKEAIEDHRSSKEDEPRSTYGKLISSADRNTSISIVFIRSFFVAHERMPETNIEEYLDYTIERLNKKYDEENPENMFYEDQTYKEFIIEMRDLLKKPVEFKNMYCKVNNIVSRDNLVKEEKGNLTYFNLY